MDSDAGAVTARPAVLVIVALLGAGGAGATAISGALAPAIACGLAALGATWALLRKWSALAYCAHEAPLERPYVPGGLDAQLARATAMETQLEFAPVALFRMGAAGGMPAEPLNASARRLLAPGRAVDRAAFGAQVAALEPGARRVIELETERGRERALAAKTALVVDGVPCCLAALMPMETELQAEATEAWQTLVRVLSHEIMNSLTPVASLTQTARGLLADAGLEAPAAADLALALDAIGRRADSLARFVDGYRQLATVPESDATPVAVAAMLARVEALVAPAWRARGGQAMFVTESPSLTLMADAGQLEQALVNLLKNALDATQDVAAPQVTVSARSTRGERLRIEVHDNGPGVPDDIVGEIFTPFFTTKAHGSGIGLAMVRQLVHRNGGTVRYVKSVGGGARFVIVF